MHTHAHAQSHTVHMNVHTPSTGHSLNPQASTLHSIHSIHTPSTLHPQVSTLALLPCDLRGQPSGPNGLIKTLQDAGFDRRIATVWSCEGILYYLQGERGAAHACTRAHTCALVLRFVACWPIVLLDECTIIVWTCEGILYYLQGKEGGVGLNRCCLKYGRECTS